MSKCNYPSVTEILGASGVVKGSQYFLPRHRIRGSLVHAATSIIGRGGTIDPSWWDRNSGNPDFPDTYVQHSECKPHVDAYAQFKAISGWCPVKFEYKVASVVGPYLGHIDEIGYFAHKPDEWWTIDKKCGGSEPWHPLQTAPYRYALISQDHLETRRGCLYLPDGKLVEHTNRTDMQKFHVLCAYYHLMQEFGV